MAEPDPPTKSSSRLFRAKSWGLVCVIVAVLAIGYWRFGGALSLEYLVTREQDLRALRVDFPVVSAAIAMGLYVLIAGLSLPGAAVMTLVFGWFFGFWRALLIVSFGSTAGATLALLLSRYLLHDWVHQKMQGRFSKVNDAFEREGAYYLFSLRLFPAIPFFVINTAMGLTSIPVRTFWWVSQLGMLPGTAAYVYAGASVPSLEHLASTGARGIVSGRMLLAFAILGLLPLVIKQAITYLANRSGHVRDTTPMHCRPDSPPKPIVPQQNADSEPAE